MSKLSTQSMLVNYILSTSFLCLEKTVSYTELHGFFFSIHGVDFDLAQDFPNHILVTSSKIACIFFLGVLQSYSPLLLHVRKTGLNECKIY